MKTILLSLIAALSLSAASFTVVTRNDSNVVTNTTVITVDLKSWNAWRLAQIATPAVPETKDAQGNIIPAKPAVLKYPTPDSLLKAVFNSWFRSNNIMYDYDAAIMEQRRQINAAQAEIERLRALAVQ